MSSGLLKNPINKIYLEIMERPPQLMAWISHETIWWWGYSNAGTLGNEVYPFIVIAHRPRVVASDRALSMDQIELFDI